MAIIRHAAPLNMVSTKPGKSTASGGRCATVYYPHLENTFMSWNKSVRQVHRWISIIFTLTVLGNFATMTFGQPPAWVVYSPLLPLFLLLASGLYLFVLPYAAKRRG